MGKTHLAAGVSRCLIELGHRVKFASATCLVQQLQQAKAELQLPLLLAKLDRYDGYQLKAGHFEQKLGKLG